MRVGFLTERMTLGYGVAVVTDRLAEGLADLGNEVTVYTVFNDDTFRGGKYGLVVLPVKSSVIASRYDSRAERVVDSAFEKGEDMWIVESFPFFKAASRFSRPWIAIDHGIVPSKYFPFLKRHHFDYIRKTQYGEYFQKASAIVCVSKFLFEDLTPILQNKGMVIHPGIDHYQRSVAVDLRRELDINGVAMLFVGRPATAAPYKGVQTLVDIYTTLKQEIGKLSLLIAGPCSMEEQRRLEAEGVMVMNGLLPEYMPSVFRCADVFATATQWEGFDLPLLEASYFGIPVVAYKIGAHPEIVKDGETGFLVSDQAEFADKLKRLVQDTGLRKQMGRKGSDYAANFRWSRAVDAFDKLVKEVGRDFGISET